MLLRTKFEFGAGMSTDDKVGVPLESRRGLTVAASEAIGILSEISSSLPSHLQSLVPQRCLAPASFAHWCTHGLGVSPKSVRRKLETYLEEDHGGGCATLLSASASSQSSQTAQNSQNSQNLATACILAKEDFVLCGLPLIAEVFHLATDGAALVFSDFQDGALVKKGQMVVAVVGDSAALLLGERVALNLSSHLSGISTFTRRVQEKIASASLQLGVTAPVLLETRKTTPGLRIFEKYATRCGGARNHRHSLDTGAMLKENHLRMLGGVERALQMCRLGLPLLTKLEIEVSNLEELNTALNHKADVVMLDNFSEADVKEAVRIRGSLNSSAVFELSGNLDRKDLSVLCSLGVDFLSMGALIHQSQWVDMSLQLYPKASI